MGLIVVGYGCTAVVGVRLRKGLSIVGGGYQHTRPKEVRGLFIRVHLPGSVCKISQSSKRCSR
jgi:hypothetical protein